ncbi:MAG: plectin [Ruminococcus sp.]|uniref:plectin n=1 Tax=Ruminococcus sp. TaxID=41978 RepID=UPI001B699B08|nr:plectin [Ruminococcus sp.]MBP5577905.1 plectin [Ruminococcus sp.]
MAEPRFIKTVTFGGYEKEAVVRRIESLNEQVHDLRNELRETKLLHEAYKKGTDQEKALESVLAEERAKLTQIQVQNNTLNLKLKATDDENSNLMVEIKSLKDEIADLKDKLKVSESKCAALMAQDEAMALSNVFIEAQKSSAMLEGAAKSKAAEIEFKTKKLAEDIVSDANVEAEQIIYEAERTAAEKIAEAKNEAEQMNVASNNLRATVLENVNSIKRHMGLVRDALEGFRKEGLSRLIEADECLNRTENTIKEGGIPVFKLPEKFEPELPEKPVSLSEKMKNDEDKRKKQEELDKLKQMAESIGGAKKDDAADSDQKDNDTKDAAEKEQKNNDEKPEGGEKKSGKVDLAALAAKANSIGKNKS